MHPRFVCYIFYIFSHCLKKKKKKERNNISTTFSQKIISDKLLLVVIVGQKYNFSVRFKFESVLTNRR